MPDWCRRAQRQQLGIRATGITADLPDSWVKSTDFASFIVANGSLPSRTCKKEETQQVSWV